MEYTVYYWTTAGWVLSGEVYLPKTFPTQFNTYDPPLRFIRNDQDETLSAMRIT